MARTNPNETRGSEKEAEPTFEDQDQTCPECGMAKEDWKGNRGRGVIADEETYCCKGCAEHNGCTCE